MVVPAAAVLLCLRLALKPSRKDVWQSSLVLWVLLALVHVGETLR